MFKWIVGGIAVFLLLIVWNVNNTLVTKNEQVNLTFAEIQTSMARRSELIDQMVGVVQSGATFEKSTLEAVIQARSQIGQAIKIDPATLANDPEAQAKLRAASESLNTAFGRLMVVSERYPELKSNVLFQNLMTTVEGSQNRVFQAQNTNQRAVQEWNTYVLQMPQRVVASFLGYGTKTYFSATDEQKKVPNTKMDFSTPKK